MGQSNFFTIERAQEEKEAELEVGKKKLKSEQIPKGHLQLVYQFRTGSPRYTESLHSTQGFSMKLHSVFTSDWNGQGT